MDELLGDTELCISVITEAEICYGLERNPQASRLRAAVAKFIGVVRILPWDSAAAQAYGNLRVRLEANGTPLDEADLMIAAHARALGAVLVSHDRVFRYLRGYVTVEDWATDLA